MYVCMNICMYVCVPQYLMTIYCVWQPCPTTYIDWWTAFGSFGGGNHKRMKSTSKPTITTGACGSEDLSGNGIKVPSLAEITGSFVCMYVCMYVCSYQCMFVLCIYIVISLCVSMYICMYVCRP